MRLPLAAAVLLASALPAVADDYPHVVLKNEKLKLTVYSPDAEKGFYRGTRFDHAGVFGNVEFAGHKIFGPWKEEHDPANHDDIVGPCEEFGQQKPLGYDEAKVGGTFLKIGVGELEKPKEERYSFATKYKLVKPAEWKQTDSVKGIDQPLVAWTAQQKANGYGYSYVKAVVVGEPNRKDPAVIGVTHTLKNTGEKRLVTDFYNHNFFNVDGGAVGPDYSLVFPFEPKAEGMRGKFGALVESKGKELHFKEKVPAGEFVMAGLTGFDAKQRSFEMRHAPSRVRVRVDHSYPFAKFNVWGIKTTICPEPFMAVDLKPGESVSWNIVYHFTHEPRKD